MNMNNSFCAAVFDVDGTLFDTLPALAATANQVLMRAGLTAIAPAMLRPALSEGLVPMFRQALAHQGRLISSETAARLEHEFLRLYTQAKAQPFDGVSTMLETLAAQGIRLAICTNRDRASTDALLAAAGFAVDFEIIVGMGDTALPKPAADPLLHVLQMMELSPSQALFVGDSGIDARCAQAAQVRFAAHREGYAGHPDDLQPQVMAFDRHDQLTQWMLQQLTADKEKCHA
jgi:phosphoglycolate phosphatase